MVVHAFRVTNSKLSLRYGERPRKGQRKAGLSHAEAAAQGLVGPDGNPQTPGSSAQIRINAQGNSSSNLGAEEGGRTPSHSGVSGAADGVQPRSAAHSRADEDGTKEDVPETDPLLSRP